MNATPTITGIRACALDTETTGLDPESGDRIIEIGAVEMIDNVRTGREFHVLIDPKCAITLAAQQVHGITAEMLEGKPVFAGIVDEFLEFIGSDTLVIHNAEFDMKFLNKELQLCGRTPLSGNRVVDSLKLARSRFPGSPASLDALCRRFKISLDGRDKHGALIDAQLLADIYLELCGGRQRSLELSVEKADTMTLLHDATLPAARSSLVIRANDEEVAAHAALLSKIANPIWNRVNA